jgi:hypothetical protein
MIMRRALAILAAFLMMASLGCSGVSTVERANLTAPAAREDYVKLHPDGTYNNCIINGEIVKGMGVYDVVASWGLPNVYAVSQVEPKEQWIYYIRDKDTWMVFAYTLTFENDTLQVWHIDQKRPIGLGIISDVYPVRELPRARLESRKKQ